MSDREERHLVRLALRFPTVSWRTLIQMSGNRVPESTARRILRRHNTRKCRCNKRPKLTALHAAKRLELCQFWKGRELELASGCKP